MKMRMENWSKGTDKGKPQVLRERNCLSVMLCATGLKWTDEGSSPCLRGERRATNRLSLARGKLT